MITGIKLFLLSFCNYLDSSFLRVVARPCFFSFLNYTVVMWRWSLLWIGNGGLMKVIVNWKRLRLRWLKVRLWSLVFGEGGWWIEVEGIEERKKKIDFVMWKDLEELREVKVWLYRVMRLRLEENSVIWLWNFSIIMQVWNCIVGLACALYSYVGSLGAAFCLVKLVLAPWVWSLKQLFAWWSFR